MATTSAPDGRTIAYQVWGVPDGTPVFGIHGTPGSRLGHFPIGDPYTEAGVCFVTYDRAGYGQSSRLPGRSVVDCVGDVVAVAEAMGWDTFAALGGSGGGPHVLACAALLPDRLTRVICDVGIAPWGAEGLDYFDGMVEGNIAEFTEATRGGTALRALLEPEAAATLERMSGDMRDILGPDYPLSEEDREVLGNPAFGQALRDDFTEAMRQGVDGWLDDDLAFVKPWGFEITDIAIPVKIRYGPEDTLVPPAHGRWLATHVPGAVEELKYGGHLDADPKDYLAQLRWLTGHSP
jgi:pimeloyl-ACP methyl ester carboxylesterase